MADADKQALAPAILPDGPSEKPAAAPPTPEEQKIKDLAAQVRGLEQKLDAATRYREQQCTEAVAAVLEKHGCMLRPGKGGIEVVTRR